MITKPLHLDVNEKIECAETLASRFYTDPTILTVERERIFHRTWQLVGTLSQSCGEVSGVARTISDPESYFTAEVAGEPIIIVRDKQGTLRAFSNVCRHRAGPIALGSGCKHVLRCQYHGWTYTLEGKLIGTPDTDGVEFFDRSTMGMVPLRVDTWEQFIFVNFDAAAPPLAEVLGQIPQQAARFQFAGLQFAERRDYVIDCNWKVYDAFFAVAFANVETGDGPDGSFVDGFRAPGSFQPREIFAGRELAPADWNGAVESDEPGWWALADDRFECGFIFCGSVATIFGSDAPVHAPAVVAGAFSTEEIFDGGPEVGSGGADGYGWCGVFR